MITRSGAGARLLTDADKRRFPHQPQDAVAIIQEGPMRALNAAFVMAVGYACISYLFTSLLLHKVAGLLTMLTW
jgi:hypothetical protein